MYCLSFLSLLDNIFGRDAICTIKSTLDPFPLNHDSKFLQVALSSLLQDYEGLKIVNYRESCIRFEKPESVTYVKGSFGNLDSRKAPSSPRKIPYQCLVKTRTLLSSC